MLESPFKEGFIDIRLLIDQFTIIMGIISFILFFYSLINPRRKVSLVIGIINVIIGFIILQIGSNILALGSVILSIYPLVKYQILNGKD